MAPQVTCASFSIQVIINGQLQISLNALEQVHESFGAELWPHFVLIACARGNVRLPLERMKDS